MNDCLVTFGYDTKTLICGRGLISAQEIYKHKDVCSMKGLKTNFTSINQICNSNYMVMFSKRDCIVYNERANTLVRGIKLEDNI